MKILELKFKNLNSLYGEWHIDFTDPLYSSNGIFALTGPTGAGKSTILDAICLALYGRTPRLGAVTSGSNEIMSRQTGECYSEIIFQTQEGKFICSWEQHRARKNPEGKLSDAKHEISDAETANIIESKKSLVGSVIESKTGMDYERFTRSILLAQGGFDTFLKADNNQKSRILEQITGTEIYSSISVKVHEKLKEENDKLKSLKDKSSGIIVIDKEEIQKLNKELILKKEKEIDISNQIVELEKTLLQINTVKELENEIRLLNENFQLIDIEKKSFEIDKIRLHKAEKASVFDGEYASLNSKRENSKITLENYKKESEQLPEAEFIYIDNLNKLKISEKNIDKIKNEKKNISPVLVKVRLLDQQIVNLKKRISILEKEYEIQSKTISEKETLKNNHIIKFENIKNEIKSAENYLKKNEQDEYLVSAFTGIEEKISAVISKNDEIEKLNIEKNDVSEKISTIELKYSEAEFILNDKKDKKLKIESLLQKSLNALDNLLDGKKIREYRTEKELLLKQKNLVERIINLEYEREKLIDGSPCPLCGSPDHPYAEGNIPEKDEIENRLDYLENILFSAEKQEDLIKTYENDKVSAGEYFSQAENNVEKLIMEKIAAQNELIKLNNDIKKNKNISENQINELSSILDNYRINNFSTINAEEIIVLLKNRLNEWNKHNSAISSSEKSINQFRSDIQNLETEINTYSISQTKLEKELESEKTEYDKTVKERESLFGEKNTDTEESRLDDLLVQAEKLLEQNRFIHNESLNKINIIKSTIESLDNKIKADKPVLEKLENDFIKMITDSGFTDENEYSQSRIDISEREELTARAKKLEEKETELNASLKDRKKKFESESLKLNSVNQYEDLNKEYDELLILHKQLINETAGIEHKLTDNEAAEDRIKEKQKEIDLQSFECSRWEKLHYYIGSADGKKYREFAQGITFEIMVSHANRQLEKMTDRYILLRSSDIPLELNIADNYQAGEIRSVKNLSGGESFIVSLSLALGLSKMASRKVRVDSLFLDEGFGTLDEDALETALETLSSLQQDGKLIGVISHVNALKERISTQVSVNPLSGGRSILTGPGCKAL